MEITSITTKILTARSVGDQERRVRRNSLAMDRKSTRFPYSLRCDRVRVLRVRRWNRDCAEDSIRVRKIMAEVRDNAGFVTFIVALVACTFFLWMFFAAATLEHTADMGGISASAARDAHAVAYEFAARWRHGMAGNSPLYMPGFFAVAIAAWFWCAGKSLTRLLAEGVALLAGAAVFAALLAPYAAPRILSDFVAQEGFSVTNAASSGTWIAWAQGVYSLLTWSTVIIASRWAIKLRSLKPLLIPLGLNVVLALVRPWTVADFTSQWVRQALDGEPIAVISFLLVPLLAIFLAWVALRPTQQPRQTASQGLWPGGTAPNEIGDASRKAAR